MQQFKIQVKNFQASKEAGKWDRSKWHPHKGVDIRNTCNILKIRPAK